MDTRTSRRGLQVAAIAFVIAFAACGVASASGHGGGGGGGHGGGGFGSHGGGGRAVGGHFGGGGYRYGGRYGSYGGHYGGYGRYGYYGGWGGLGYGLFLSALPLYYSTLWWDGVPYYYADDNYYEWNSSVSEYETVRPPPELAEQAATQMSSGTKLFAYPKNGQTVDQQSRDQYECHSWARDQSGFDPTKPAGTVAAGSATAPEAANLSSGHTMQKRADYIRAESACLEARGYAVK
jgi:hypothetical protein